METVKQQISRLYYDGVNIDEAVKSLRSQNISAEVVKSIYDQLSENVEKLTTDRFHYYTIKDGIKVFTIIDCWTSRYLLNHHYESSNSAFHNIEILDLFNDKSM
jgi:hypothetical protein